MTELSQALFTRPDSSCIVRGMPLDTSAKAMLSVIIPAYNEQDNIKPLISELIPILERLEHRYTVFFVDDGSLDHTLEVIRDVSDAHPCVRFLSFAENIGQSAAFAAGFQEAEGDIFITMDADLQNDPNDIPRMLSIFSQGHDMVIGWRAKREDGLVKLASSKIANAVRNALSNENVKDTGCSLKIMRADMARRLPMFKGMHRFLPTLMKMQGATVAEVQVNHRSRAAGVSKYGIWDRAFSALRDLFAVRWMQARTIHYVIKERR